MGASTNAVNLLELPDKAKLALLQHLNIWNLMNLRLVCKTTKEWVENPEILKALCVHVRERKFLKKLIKSSVKWSSLLILCDTLDLSGGWIKDDDYFRTFAKLNTALRVLKFSEQRVPFNGGLDTIFLNCTQLQKLEVGTLDLKNLKFPIREEIQNSLCNLTSLSVMYVAWESEIDLEFFPQILGRCTTLNYLKIPYILTATLYSLYPSAEETEIDEKHNTLTNKVLFKPINDLLLLPLRTLKYLDVENYECEQLLESLSVACKTSGCLLLNVLEMSERAFTNQENDACDRIGSLLNCTTYLDLTLLNNLRSINITNDFTATTDISKKFESARLPSLKDVNLTLTQSILCSARLASCFLQQKRESVETVSVKFDGLKGSGQASVFRSPKFAISFPNLRSLCLDGFDGKPSDYLLFWSNFPGLAEVRMQNCRTLNDFSLLGDTKDHPAFLNLKNLRKLSLEDAEVTDKVLEKVIRKIPLEVLVLDLSQVTYAGLSYLKISQLAESLMVLYCLKPDECLDATFKDFFLSFKNLKKYEILF